MKRSGPIQRKTPLRKVSKKRASIQGQRRKLVQEQLAVRPQCEAGPVILADEVKRFGVAFVRERSKTDRCYGRSTDIHEPLQRSAGGSILDVENTISVCRRCHDWIHSFPEYAVELGLLRYSWQGRENNSE